jgi:threonyl-tRNA synthetase
MIIIINNNIIFFQKKKLFFEEKKNFFRNTQKYFISIYINGKIKDIIDEFNINSTVYFIKINSFKALNIIRHSCAHLLAQSLINIYTNIKLSIGPVIKNGFYYDFFSNIKLSFSDLKKIEKEMFRLINKKYDIIKTYVSIELAKSYFKNNKYKLEILDNINDQKISIYTQANFFDLCRGPHLPNINFLKFFKLIKISGAYWKNNSKNEMLYRIYGTAWESKRNLQKYVNKINNLKECDHRVLGKQLNLFDFYKHSPGVVFWNKDGWKIYLYIKNFIKEILKKINHLEVNTPIITGTFLFKKSKHIEKFIENMFICQVKNNISVLKPMNCPCHIELFNNFYKKSYKNLPFRIAEFGSCFRNELSGSLHGLMRLKNFTQDDGHIFCSDYHIENEIINFIHILKNVYYKFGFNVFKLVLSKKPKNIEDNLETWDKAEKILENVIKKLKINYSISNDGAFYGPKLEFSLRDNFNRIWQCGTIQVDFFTAKNLNAKYIDHKGFLQTPIILHRAILGSIERFIGILIENGSGYLPFCVTAIHFILIYISNKYLFYAKNIYNIIKNKYNTKIYFGNERLEYKIKQCILKKIPYTIIVGNKEYLSKVITLRDNKTNSLITLSITDFFKKFNFKGD